MDPQNSSWIVLAQLLRPQGRKGELLAELLTDFPERFGERSRVFLAPPSFSGAPSDARSIEITGFWLPVGKNQGRVVLHFTGIDSISDAETLAGLEVIVPHEERLPIDNESTYISDLIGCTLYDGTTPVGIVTDVHFATTPDGTRRLEEAAPLFVVESPTGDEILIPFANAFVVNIDTAARRIDMNLPPGLVEVNQTPVT